MCSQPNHLTCPKVNELDRVLWRQTSNPAPIAHWHVHLPMESHGKIGATAPEAEPRTTGFETSQKTNVQISEKKDQGMTFLEHPKFWKKKHEGLFWNQFFPLKTHGWFPMAWVSFWDPAIRHVLNSSHIQPIGDMAKHQGLLLSSFGAGPPLHWSQQHGMLCPSD